LLAWVGEWFVKNDEVCDICHSAVTTNGGVAMRSWLGAVTGCVAL
jgi:hypothetical protein